MIPKIIHYCWFGRGEKTELMEKCIKSWKEYCPDYEIIEWNEDNFDVSRFRYTKYCYENKKWAFLSDFVRLLVIEEYGGIYFDTDVELVKNLDELLSYDAFYGFENRENVATGLGFGSVKGHKIVECMKKIYLENDRNEEGEYVLTPCPKLNTEVLLRCGLILDGKRQNVLGAEIFPIEYFNPYDWSNGKLKLSPETISIHHYAASWQSDGEKKNNIERHNYEKIKRKYGKIPADIYSNYFWSKKENGGNGLIRTIYSRILKLPKEG